MVTIPIWRADLKSFIKDRFIHGLSRPDPFLNRLGYVVMIQALNDEISVLICFPLF